MKTTTIDWQAWLAKYLDDDQQTPLSIDSQIVVGQAVLDESPDFVARWLDFVAQESGQFTSHDALITEHELNQFTRPSAGLFAAKPNAYRELKSRQMILDVATNPTGYTALVDYVTGGTLRQFLSSPVPLFLDERKRAKHSFVAGSSGSGKSEYLKGIIYEYITRRPNDCIVIIDPHGELAYQVAKWPEVALLGRLALIDPSLIAGYTPAFNPLEIDSDPLTLEVILNQLFQSITTVLGADNQFSDTMSALLKPIVKYLLLREEPSSLDHLMQFVLGNETMRDEALQVLPNVNDRAYLEANFGSAGNRVESIGVTKHSIQTRLQQLLGEDVFRAFTCSASSFDLEDLIRQSKVIIFSLKETSGSNRFSPMNAIGRFIFAQLLSIVMKKDHPRFRGNPLPPIHAFVDEAHNYTIPAVKTVLAEARKYQLYLTLATQTIKNFTDQDIRGGVLKNCFVKFAGFQPNGVTDNASLVGVSPNDVTSLRKGEFYVSPGDLPRFKVRGRADLLGESHSVSAGQWQEVLEEQK
ncbi:MAG: type IV secretory system conjugative DNA transfer family protein, partial [Verrucomicrobiota bacterium]